MPKFGYCVAKMPSSGEQWVDLCWYFPKFRHWRILHRRVVRPAIAVRQAGH